MGMGNGGESSLAALRIFKPQAVFKAVEAEYGYSLGDLREHSRRKRRSFARQIAMYLLRQDCWLSLPEIGSLTKRDHGTVMSAIKRIKGFLAEEPCFAETLNAVRRHYAPGFSAVSEGPCSANRAAALEVTINDLLARVERLEEELQELRLAEKRGGTGQVWKADQSPVQAAPAMG